MTTSLHPPPDEKGRGLRREPGPEETTEKLRSQQDTPPKRIRKGTKFASLLRAFLRAGLSGLNRWDAAREARDWVLPSSVASLTRLYGFTFPRKDETITVAGGFKVQCSRYWFSDEDRALALSLLDEEVTA